MKILAIDPGITKGYGFAYYLDRMLLWQLGVGNVKDIAKMVAEVDHVFIEDQYFAGNNSTLRLLAQSAGKIAGICEESETDYTMVHPSKWRSKAKFNPKKPEGVSAYHWKKQKNALLIQFAKNMLGDDRVNVENEDVAAAVIIGYVMGVELDGARGI